MVFHDRVPGLTRDLARFDGSPDQVRGGEVCHG